MARYKTFPAAEPRRIRITLTDEQHELLMEIIRLTCGAVERWLKENRDVSRAGDVPREPSCATRDGQVSPPQNRSLS